MRTRYDERINELLVSRWKTRELWDQIGFGLIIA